MGRASKGWIYIFFFEKWKKLKNQEKSPTSFSVRHNLGKVPGSEDQGHSCRAGQGRAGAMDNKVPTICGQRRILR